MLLGEILNKVKVSLSRLARSGVSSGGYLHTIGSVPRPFGNKQKVKTPDYWRCVMNRFNNMVGSDTGALLDSCIWLPEDGSGNVSGWLLAKGWAFVEGAGPQVALGFERSPGKFEPATDFLSPLYYCRNDVNAVYPLAPLNSGFTLAIPLDRPLRQTNHPALLFRHNSRQIPLRINGMHDASDPDRLSREYSLDPLRMEKLKNLMLNERERLKGVVLKQSRPISIYFDPSFACNLECCHCVSQMLRQQGMQRKPLTPDLVEKILDRHGKYLIRATLALWGEPFLNKNFAGIVRLCKQHGIFCETSTNLSLHLTDEQIEEIVRSGLDEMRMSIDGATQDTYARYRIKGNLQLVLENVRRLVDAKRRLGSNTPKLRWQYLLFPWNEHERELAAGLANQLNVDEFYSFRGDLWTNPPPIEGRVTSDDFVELGDGGQKLHEIAVRRNQNLEHFGCDFLDHTLAIHSDGAVFPCCYYPAPKDSLGQWPELEADAFNAPRLIQMRQFVQDVRRGIAHSGPSPCAKCGSLGRGYVEDHIDFMKGFELVIRGQ